MPDLLVILGGNFYLQMQGIQVYMYALIKVNNGPTCKIINGLMFIFTNYKWPHTSQTKGGVGYT